MTPAINETIKQPVFWLFTIMIIGSVIGIIWFQSPSGKKWLGGGKAIYDKNDKHGSTK